MTDGAAITTGDNGSAVRSTFDADAYIASLFSTSARPGRVVSELLIGTSSMLPHVSALATSSSEVQETYEKLLTRSQELENAEDEARKVMAHLRRSESQKADYLGRLAQAEPDMGEQGSMMVDTAVARVEVSASQEIQDHYARILGLRESADAAEKTTAEMPLLLAGMVSKSSGPYHDYARKHEAFAPTPQGKQPACLSAKSSKLTDVDAMYMDPQDGRWGASLPRRLVETFIIRLSTRDHSLLVFPAGSINVMNTYLEGRTKRGLQDFEVWLSREPGGAGWEYYGSHIIDYSIPCLPFVDSVTGYIPELFEGYPKSTSDPIHWRKLKIAWHQRSGKHDYVFRVLKYSRFNQSYFNALASLPPAIEAASEDSSTKRARTNTSDEAGPAPKVPRLDAILR